MFQISYAYRQVHFVIVDFLHLPISVVQFVDQSTGPVELQITQQNLIKTKISTTNIDFVLMVRDNLLSMDNLHMHVIYIQYHYTVRSHLHHDHPIANNYFESF